MTGLGLSEREFELANEANGAAVLAGQKIGLLRFLPVEIDGAHTEKKSQRADKDIEHLVERAQPQHPLTHALIMARTAYRLQETALPVGDRMRGRAVLLRKQRGHRRLGYPCYAESSVLMSKPSGSPTLLAVDDDPLSLDLAREALQALGPQILTAATGAEAREKLEEAKPQIVLLDLMLPDVSGLELLEEIVQTAPGTDVILLTGHYTPESAVEAIRKGACDYLTKPVKISALRSRVKELIDDAQRRLDAARLETELLHANRFQRMVGRSPQMLELFALIRRVAPHFRVALVRGATGTGKELAAHALHALSPVAAGPFVIANCSAITESLFESEMFGHLKGSFTGAANDKKGLFEAAHGGTLFLDELGDLPFAMQSKLLRAIQQQEIKPVGATATRKISVRVVAATNRDLEEMMGSGSFREDLYYRLSMVEVHVPKLEDRMEDFPFLVRHFVTQFADEYGKPLMGVTHRAQALLAKHSWPGNIRELENVIGSACMMADGTEVDVRDLPPVFHRVNGRQPHEFAPEPAAENAAPAPAPGPAEVELISLDLLNKRHARQIVEHFGGNKSKAAEVLGVTRSTLYRLLGES